jgi:hypothetical protein
MNLKNIARTLPPLAAGVGGAFLYGAWRGRRKSEKLRAAMRAAQLPPAGATYHAREITALPTPVRRYFRAVLKDGQPIISAARFSQTGEFRAQAEGNWNAFDATQLVTTRPPAFDWDARIQMARGVTVRVHDAYIAGEGVLRAELFGLVPVADERGTPEMAEGELMRYLAEAAWYPTALLPGAGVLWEARDDHSARATLSDGATTVALDFCFGDDCLIQSVCAERRRRGEGDYAAWQGWFRDYQKRDGMLIPLQAEVAWHEPQGVLPYWRGRISEIYYEFAAP